MARARGRPCELRALWGTGLALRLGHRSSVDFFSSEPLRHATLEKLPFAKGAEVLQEERDTLTLSVDRGAPVKLS